MHNPNGDRRLGTTYTSSDLATLLNRQRDIFRTTDGGVTFSGGEPLFQAAFLAEVIDQLDAIHCVLDTSGFASEENFRIVASRVQCVLFDLKIMDAKRHREWTGQDNRCILRNLEILSTLGIPFVVRVPLVPGVTDTEDNLTAMNRFVRDLPNILRVDLLPYNRAAGAKYAACGMTFQPHFDEARPLRDAAAMCRAFDLEVAVVS
jgi:pyruvate formate lyase activating enzyme